LGLALHADYDTAQDFSYSATLRYTLTQRTVLVVSYDSDYRAGAGLAFRF
jgi:hypothetical protein